MVKKTVLKVDTSCFKCKKKLLKAVSSLQGVDKIEVDEAKSTLTVTGDADPYDIIVSTRKVAKYVEVVSIGPPPPPPKKPEEKKPEEKKPEEKKKPDEKKTEAPKPNPMGPIYWPYSSYPPYQPVAVVHYKDEPNPACTIM